MKNQSTGSFRRRSHYGHVTKQTPPWLAFFKKVDPMVYVILAVILLVLLFFAPQLKLYEVKIDNEIVGYIKDPGKLELIHKKALEKTKASFELSSIEPVFPINAIKTSRANNKASTEEELIAAICEKQSFVTTAYILQIGTENFLSSVNRDKIEEIIQSMKQKLAQPGEDSLQVQFQEKVIISEQKIKIQEIMNPVEFAQAKVALLEQIRPDIYYTIEKGDTISKIAQSNGVTIQWIQTSNPELDINKIAIGQQIKIQSEHSLLHRN